MPTLGELKTEGNMKVLGYGKPGSGKTVGACSFPYPALLLDFDGKADSAALFYKGDTERLNGIDVRDLSAKIGVDPIQELMKIIDKELIPATKSADPFPYKTIILDSVTTFSKLVLEHIVKTNPGMKRVVTKQGVSPGLQDYGILKREFGRLIPGLLSLPCNVVMLAHIDTEKDELTGEILRHPLMDGAFSKQLPIYFKEVYHLFVDEKGNYMAQTKSDRKYSCRSQIPGLPNPVPFNYEELAKKL
jgi:hypothetical protein